MKKFGFTLSEILISLGIVGIIAALTAPSLISDSNRRTIAAKLSVTAANLEKAFTSAIMEEGVDQLDQTSIFRSPTRREFSGNLARYMNIARLVDGDSDDYYERGPFLMSGAVVNNGFGGEGRLGEFFPIMLKNGAVVHVLYRHANGNQYDSSRRENERNIHDAGGSLVEADAEIVIDANGQDGPNTIGRDIFAYRVSTDGILYPVGGRDFAIFISSPVDRAGAVNSTNMWNNNAASDATICLDRNLGNGLGCAGRVVDEDYRITY